MTDPSTFGASSTDADGSADAAARQPEYEPGGRHAIAEGHADPTKSTDAVWEALSNTDPNTPLEQVESPWNPVDGGMARIFRAVQKMTGANALPAWADILIGAAEFMTQMDNQQSDDREDTDGPDITVMD